MTVWNICLILTSVFKILHIFYRIFDFIFKSGYVYEIPGLSGKDVVDKNVSNKLCLVEREKIKESAILQSCCRILNEDILSLSDETRDLTPLRSVRASDITY